VGVPLRSFARLYSVSLLQDSCGLEENKKGAEGNGTAASSALKKFDSYKRKYIENGWYVKNKVIDNNKEEGKKKRGVVA
jgi:hypothetical protein